MFKPGIPHLRHSVQMTNPSQRPLVPPCLRSAMTVALVAGFILGWICTLQASSARADVADDRWQPDSSAWHWGRDHQIDLIDTRLDLRLDPAVVRVEGSVTLTFTPVVPKLQRLHLDAERLTITVVKDATGHDLTFTGGDNGLDVEFNPPLSPPETTWIRIEYRGEPAMGLYFIPSVKEDPEKAPIIWSQGEEEDNRYWFPGYDYPDDKGTAQINITTPQPYVVVSNGALARQDDNPDGTRTFHWVEKIPISTYLIALAVGEFDSLVQKTIDGLPVTYYCRKGEGEKLQRSLGETPGMIEFFAEKIGVPFPFEKYAQAIVPDFVYGGMENASLTIENERVLYGPEAADFYRDGANGLVAHELAHQWFGDLLTCRDWAHAWLNEGFATYFGDLWEEHRWGHDRFLLSMTGTLQGALGATRRYRRSTVHHQYDSPSDLFDGYAYSRGGAVLHMIHGILGDSLWWAGIHRYVTDNATRTVETEDLKRAFETVSGRDFDGFFNQWIYHGGHPELKIETSYGTDTKMLRIDVHQTQKVDAVTPVFDFPLDIEWVTAQGRERRRVQIYEADNTFYFMTETAPVYILFDPDEWLLSRFEYKPPVSALVAQARDPDRVIARLRAVTALGEREKSPQIVGVLTTALRRDIQPAIRRAAADALAQLGGDDARDSLLTAWDDPDARTRNSVIYALAKFEGDKKVFDRLEALAKSNAIAPLRGSAVDAASMVDPDRAVPLARWALEQHTEKHTVEIDALSALERSKDPALTGLALRYIRPGNPTPIRAAAVRLIASVAEFEKDNRTLDKTRLALEVYLGDRNMNFRRPVMGALGKLHQDKSIPALERVERQSLQPSERQAARDAIGAIRNKKPEDQPNTMAKKFDEATEDRKRLQERIETLEKRVDTFMAHPNATDSSKTEKSPKPSGSNR